VIRAWKDEEYRLSLSETERAFLPAHPAGLLELNEAELEGAAGAVNSEIERTYAVGCTYGWKCYSTSWTCNCWSF
jgi:mersacidin/lichenicidin family type 2 lantibiotic